MSDLASILIVVIGILGAIHHKQEDMKREYIMQEEEATDRETLNL